MIKVNKAKCLICGDIIESLHRHDYQSCSCGNISVDGGRDYLKRSAMQMDKYEELSVRPDCFLGEEEECSGFEYAEELDEGCKTCPWRTENYEE